MIITFSDDMHTQKAVRALCSTQDQVVGNYFRLSTIVPEQSDKTLILLDLSANGRTQELIEPALIIENLNKHQLLKHIKFIQIIISDVAPSMPMTTFTWELNRAIIEAIPTSQIFVTFSGNMDEEPSFVEPPDTPDDKWVVHNIPKGVAGSVGSFGIYKSKATGIHFKGDIQEYLNNGGDHQIELDTVRATYVH